MFQKAAAFLAPTASEVVRIWRVPRDAALPAVGTNVVHVVLRHLPVGNSTSLTVDGVEQPPPAADGQAEFTLPNEQTARLTIKPGSALSALGLGSFSYALHVGGQRVPENTETLSDYPPGSVPAGESDVKIVDYVVCGDGVVWYCVRRAHRDVLVHRRFRDFYHLYGQVCGAFRGTHLYSSVPVPPSRESALTADHTSPSFLEARREALSAFLRKILVMPGVAGGRNPDVQEFLGLNDPCAETSVVFFQGPMGLGLKPPPKTESQPSVFAAQVMSLVGDRDDRPPGQAYHSGRVAVGDMLTRIGGESALMCSYESVIEKLKLAPRPLVLHFLGFRDGPPGASRGEAQRAAPAPPARTVPVGAATPRAEEEEEA